MRVYRFVAASCLMTVSALVTLTSCASEPGNDDCGSDHGDVVRALEAGLLEIEGVARTYRGSNTDGEVRVDLTVDVVDASHACAAPTGIQLARFVSDLFVPNAYASCSQPSVSPLVTYTVTWAPSDGSPEVLHDQVVGSSSYFRTEFFRDAFDEGTTLVVGSGEMELSLVSRDGDPDNLTLRSFRDLGVPLAVISP